MLVFYGILRKKDSTAKVDYHSHYLINVYLISVIPCYLDRTKCLISVHIYLTTTEYQLISIFVIMYHNYDTPSHFIVTYFPDAGTPMMQKIYFLSRGNIAWA